MENLPEIMLVDKPKDITSFGLLGLLRKKFGIQRKIKMGHAGTLDPMATGLMIVGIGSGTKKLKDYVGLDKVYKAEILLGIQTDTGDIEGTVLQSEKVKIKKSRFLLTKNEHPRLPKGKSVEKDVAVVVEGMVGKWILPVPAYSATKQGGEALYKKVRRGERVIIPKREMEITGLKVESVKSKEDKVYINVELEVTSGTYIRSIAEEIGKRLGVPATLSALRRTKVGNFDVGDAIGIQKNNNPTSFLQK